jgi:hypothetical protein
MELERSSTDALEQQLIADERLVARLRSRQMAVLEELDVRQVATGDGARSLSEWVSGRLDVGPETAKTLVRTMRRLQDRPDLSDDLASGRVSFDRIEAVSRIHADVGLLEWTDVALGFVVRPPSEPGSPPRTSTGRPTTGTWPCSPI